MYEWLKKAFIGFLLLAITISMEMYKDIYLFLDKFIPDKNSKEEKNITEDKYVFYRNDIFDTTESFDDDFMDKDIDDFKDMLTVVIMLVIDIIVLIVLIKADVYVANMINERVHTLDGFKSNNLFSNNTYFK